ncbi:hypothetical protein BC941DRAFT_106385 [Chlamydoabsidia padenii]|nr:hypothetical protein BC941DRAFT_106385 [Chlamydoabsidia padenii]
MIRWRTLNKDDEIEQLDNTEIQTEHLLEIYQNALNIHQKGQRADAKAKYELILSNDIMTAEDTEEQTEGNALHSSSLVTLRFLVFKNYAAILKEESSDVALSKTDRTGLLQKALDYYIKALAVDPTDRSIWYHIGVIATLLHKRCLARSSFETGFYLDTSKPQQQQTATITTNSFESLLTTKRTGEKTAYLVFSSSNISPTQWRCLEGLCKVLYDIGDFDLCSTYLKLGLARFPGWTFASDLEYKMANNQQIVPSIDDDENMESHYDQPIIMKIATSSWTSVLSLLLDQYKQDQHTHDDVLTCMNRAIQIDIELRDDTTDQDTTMLDSHDTSDKVQQQQDTSDATTDIIQDQPPIIADNTANNPMDQSINQETDSTQSITTSPALIKVDTTGDLHHFDTSDKSANDETLGIVSSATQQQQQNDRPAQNSNNSCMIDLTLGDQDDGGGPLKRKRDDEDEKNGVNDKDDDDEQEHEAKRTSLRASKRQKEKVESEEVFRKKMMEEEESLNKMAQDVFDTFGNFDDFRRGTPWCAPVNPGIDTAALESFWEFFDLKVSELGATFTWNFETFKAKNVFSVMPSKKYQFAKFDTSMRSLPASTSDTTASVRQFVHSLNETNSGATDSLCRTIVAILRLDTQSSGEILGDELIDLLSDATETLGQELLNTILRNNQQDKWSQPEDSDHQIQMMTCLCEKLVDRLIDSIRTEQTSLNGPMLSSKQRSLVDKQNKLIKHYREGCSMWIDLVDQVFVQGAIDSFGPSSLTNGDIKMDQAIINKKKLLLRFWLLKGKMAQCENDVDTAVAWYKKCERLFVNMDNGELELTLNCRYDATVNLAAIQHKLALMERDKYVAASEVKLADNDYIGAMNQLEALVVGQTKYEQAANSIDAFSITTMLAKCYVKTERYADAWKCYVDIMTTLVPQLVVYGSNCIKNNTILPKGDDVEFFRLLCLLDTTVDALVYLLLDTKYEDWLPSSISSHFVDSLMIMLRTTMIYTFRHPDFIPLVNNFSNPDVKPHVPSRKTKINSYNAVTTKLWVMTSTLAQRNIQKVGDGDKMTSLANLLQNMHDELGEREVCGASKGIFLQHLIKLLSNVDFEDNRRGIYQCYHCLYGVHLMGEAELIEEHHANHGSMTEKAAEHLYKLVIDDVMVKMDRNLPLKSDLKDAIETVSGLFEELPGDNPYIQRNRDIITSYLERPVNIDLPTKSLLQQCDLPIDGTHGNMPSISVVYDHMFLIRGKILRMHIKNRPKLSSDKTMADLEEAVEQFKCHVILHPNDHQGWYELGSTLLQLAEEELTWSAVNIITHKDLIGDYQKQSFHAFMKTWRLASNGQHLKKKQLFGFFTSFGSLVYSMACAPMNMAAFEWTRPLRTLDKTGSPNVIQPMKPNPARAYRLALTLFFRALSYKSQDRSEWCTLRSIGKCANNLKRPPKEVLDWYVKSIRHYRDTGNMPLEALYKLYATLLKYLYRGSIDTRDVFDYLNLVDAMQKTDQHAGSALLSTATATSPLPPPSLYHPVNDSNSVTGIVDLSTINEAQPTQGSGGRPEAFGRLFDKLTELRKSDKKHWHHRPVYKIAWMYHKIYKDAEQAKSELLPLFALKQPNKGLVNIWRSEHERPGKHFVFNRQYVTFLIDLAKETNDLDTLKNMCRKLKRASTTLLKEDEGFKEALSAYIEVLRGETLNPLQGSTKRQQIITGPVNKEDFDTMCKDLTKDMASSTGTHHYIVPILQDLMDIRRQAVGYVSTDDLDVTIQECFAVLLFEQTKIQSLLPQSSSTTTATTTITPLLLPSPSQYTSVQNTNGPDDSRMASNPMQHLDTTSDSAIKSPNQDISVGIEGKVLLHRAVSLAGALNGRTQ